MLPLGNCKGMLLLGNTQENGKKTAIIYCSLTVLIPKGRYREHGVWEAEWQGDIADNSAEGYDNLSAIISRHRS